MNKDINTISGKDGAAIQAFVIAGVVAVIAVIAAVYVSVGTTLTVGITAGFSISIAVMTAITVGSWDPYTSPNSIIEAKGELYNLSTFDDLLMLDNNLQEKTQLTSRIALILGNNKIYAQNIQHTLSLELEAVLNASEQSGVVDFGGNKTKVHEALLQLVCEAVIGRYDFQEDT